MEDVILREYEIRKSNKEKTRFIEYLKDRLAKKGYDKEKDITIETKGIGLFKSRNIVVGNLEEAEVIITAHYDTCAVMFMPNLIAPGNPILFWLYQIILAVVIIAIGLLVAIPAMLISGEFEVGYYLWLATLILLSIQIMVGYRNKHTANDNTSGILVLTRLLEELSKEDRKKVCVVYFDNEEKGLLGSAFFAKLHKDTMKEKMLINLDCVGDGEHIMFMAKSKARKDKNYKMLVDTFETYAEKADVKYICKKMKPMMYPSDQANFASGVGVCSLKKSVIGLYAARIHTPFDTKCRKENILYLTQVMSTFIRNMKSDTASF